MASGKDRLTLDEAHERGQQIAEESYRVAKRIRWQIKVQYYASLAVLFTFCAAVIYFVGKSIADTL